MYYITYMREHRKTLKTFEKIQLKKKRMLKSKNALMILKNNLV